MPFRFGLERVRELRAHDEDRAREEFAASLSRRMRDAAQLAAAAEVVEQARAWCRTAASGMTGQHLIANHLWLERLERDRRQAEFEVARRDVEVEARRQALGTAKQRREVLERLKERHRAEHQLAGARRAGAALDEMALAIHRRRGGR